MSKEIKYCHCGIRSHGHGLCRKHYQEIYRDKQDERYFTSIKGRWNVLKTNAKHHNKECSLSLEDVEWLFEGNPNCYYCGGKIGRGSGLDRIDNTQGYHMGNVVPCCDGCNSLKSELLSFDETLEVVKLLQKLRNRKNIWE